jgi:proprotein convertase subtilisin/kexin type 5
MEHVSLATQHARSVSVPQNMGVQLCSTNRVLTADGACECPINTDVASGCLAISTCHQSCLTCFGPNSNNCLTCPQNSLLTQLNSCVCMSSYYLTTTPIWSCTACSLQCSTCSSSPASCTSCDSTKLLYLQGSTCNCPSSYSLSVTPSSAQCTALACHPHCSTCSSQLVTFCTQCQPARLLTSTNACICRSNSYIIPSTTSSDPNDILSTAQCQLCSPLCATCTGSNSDQCITCIQNAVLGRTFELLLH